MKIYVVKLYQEFDAPVEEIWEAFNDHENFGKMTGTKVTRIADSADTGNVNGTGSVRKIHLPLFPFEETIRKSEKPNCIEYQISKGTPLAHHYGTMLFNPLPGNRCAIDYTIALGSHIPLLGGMVKVALEKAMGGSMERYAKGLR
jgi:uncharacterized protein YndB with AHSA1/START domain